MAREPALEALTGRTRYRAMSRWNGPPLLVLQVEVRFPDGPVDGDGLPTYLQGTAWRDAKVEDLPTLPGLAQEA